MVEDKRRIVKQSAGAGGGDLRGEQQKRSRKLV